MPSPPDLLARVPLFQVLTEEDLSWVADATRVEEFAEGEHLFEIGEPGQRLYILTEGIVEVIHPNRPSSFQLARMGPGEFIGEMALLNDAPRSATARAACDCAVLVLEKEDFHRLVLERPGIGLKLLEVLSRRMRAADEQIGGLSSEAVRDPLTGLLNRLAFNDRLEEEAARVRRYGGSFSLILVDLDNFAAINEAHGLDVGDQVLAWIGRLLNEHTRSSDVPFRYEQDVYSILCPSTPAEVAGTVANRLAALVAEAKPPVEVGVPLALASSSATCPDHAQEADALYDHAQRELLAAKAKSGPGRR